MKNTTALAALILGMTLIYSGLTGKALSNVLKMAIGQEEDPSKDMKIEGGGNVIPGVATANPKDRPGYREDQLEKNADGSIKRDADGYAVLIPGAVPFDPSQVAPPATAPATITF